MNHIWIDLIRIELKFGANFCLAYTFRILFLDSRRFKDQNTFKRKKLKILNDNKSFTFFTYKKKQ